MDIHGFCKEHYFFEADRRHQLTGSLSIPIGVLTVLIGTVLVMVQGMRMPFNMMDKVQISILSLSAVFMLASIYFLIRSYFNYSYGYIATPEELKHYYDKLIAYYKAINAGVGSNAAEELEEYITCEYAKYAHRNALNNNQKSYYLHKANGFLVGALITILLSGIPYLIHIVSAPTNVQKIEIVNFKPMGGDKMAEEKQEVKPTQIVKPSPPPGRVIKESEDPRKVK